MRASRWLALSMAAGAVYDLAFGIAMLLAHERAAGILGIEPPDDPLYLRFGGLLLLVLGALYLLPARDPERYRGVALVAAAGRLAGFLFLFAAWRAGRPPVFLGLCCADLTFALVHAFFLARTRRGPNDSSS